MAATTPLYTGVDNIMAAYESVRMDLPYYSVWHSDDKKKAFEWNDDDIEAGTEYMRKMMEVHATSGNTSLLWIHIHPEKKNVYGKDTPDKCSLPVRPCTLEQSRVVPMDNYNPGQGMNFEMWETMKAVRELPTMLKPQFDNINERLLALETGDDDEEEEPQTLVGQITGVLQNQELMGTIMGFAKMLFPGLGGAATPQPAAPQHMISGINDTAMAETQGETQGEPQAENVDMEKVMAALTRLNPHCDLETDLSLLATMAETNPAIFNMLLTQLRSQK